ncbi:hypothetical protein UPYG_G00037380 [Umbra pygmaea]|uniref:Uncharacterized protein n=1 Tax=Umbra pygmaea TaxID=75934 RepID=A0ABD0Y7Z2_UMBPY
MKPTSAVYRIWQCIRLNLSIYLAGIVTELRLKVLFTPKTFFPLKTGMISGMYERLAPLMEVFLYVLPDLGII